MKTSSDRDRADLTAALADAVHCFDIPISTFDAFGRSMRMDLPGHPLFRNRYATFAELGRYTYGSAAVIGRQLLPVLGADVQNAEVASGAELLGEAFQLTNFLRDIGEDADRDRIYLPLSELAAFGVDEEMLFHDVATQKAGVPLRRAVAHLIAVNRDQYRRTDAAIAALPRAPVRPSARPRARTARSSPRSKT